MTDQGNAALSSRDAISKLCNRTFTGPMRPRSRWFYLHAVISMYYALGLAAWIYDEVAYGGQSKLEPAMFVVWSMVFACWAVRAWEEETVLVTPPSDPQGTTAFVSDRYPHESAEECIAADCGVCAPNPPLALSYISHQTGQLRHATLNSRWSDEVVLARTDDGSLVYLFVRGLAGAPQ